MLTLEQKIDFIYETLEDLVDKVSSPRVIALEEENRDLRQLLDDLTEPPSSVITTKIGSANPVGYADDVRTLEDS